MYCDFKLSHKFIGSASVHNLADLIFIAVYTLKQSYPKWIFKQNCQSAFHHHAIGSP